MTSDVIVPYKTSCKSWTSTSLTPNNVNITTELEHINDPHEWVELPTDSSLSSVGNLENDSPDLRFLLQKRETLDQLQDFIISKSGVQ